MMSTTPLFGRGRLILQGDVGVVSVRGADSRRFLQGLGTNDFEEAQSGTSFLTAFCNAKGVCLDYAQVLCTDEDFKFICQPSSRAGTLLAFFDKFLFPLDKVTVKDESSTATLYRILGEEGESSISTGFVQGENTFTFSESDGIPSKCVLVQEGGSSGILLGYGDQFVQGAAAAKLTGQLRRLVGRPSMAIDVEPYNATALEAGLMHGLHFRKGCFVGNEIVSKQVRTKAVRKHLVGLRCNHNDGGGVVEGAKLVEPESGEVVGFVSSSPVPLSEEITAMLSDELQSIWGITSPALGYAKTKLAEKGTSLQVAGVEVQVEPLAFPRFAVSASPAPPVEKVKTRGKDIRVDLEEVKGDEVGEETPEEKEAARKATKLAAMAAKVAAMKAKKKKG